MVSIIIPVYNSSPFLYACVYSILGQTWTDFEVLLINDGSTDNSGELCDELSLKDERIRVFHKENGGAGAARKYGVEKAKGEWIMFVDSDDTITSTSLELLMSRNKDYDIIAGAINKDGKLFGHQKDGVFDKEKYIQALLKLETTDGPVAKLFKHELFIKAKWETPKEITLNEDMLMLIAISKEAKKIYLSSEIVCYNYISRAGSASTSYKMNFNSWIFLFNLIEGLIGELLINSFNLRKAFVIYRLERVHQYIINNNSNIKKCEYLTNLANESKEFSLEKPYSHFTKLLESYYARCWEHFQYKFKIYQIGLVLGRKAKVKLIR